MAKTTPKTETTVPPVREQILQTAINLTTGDRNRTYGSASVNMECLAAFMRVYQGYRGPRSDPDNFSAHDAAMFMVLSKVARIAVGSNLHTDNYIDGAAYLAIAAEVDGA